MASTVSISLTDTVAFPVGATVEVFLARGFPGPVPPQPGQSPSGLAVVRTAVATAAGVTLTGLEPEVRYWAASSGSGEWRWVGFTTPGLPITEGPEGPEGPAGTGGAPGAWTVLAGLGAKVEGAAVEEHGPAEYRLEQGGRVVRMRGCLRAKAGQTLGVGGTLFTLPEALRPLTARSFLVCGTSGGAFTLTLRVGGEASIANTLTEGKGLFLDELQFSLT